MLKLLTAATATNSPPTTATQGFSLKGRTPGQTQAHTWYHRDSGVIIVRSTAGTGTMTVTLRVWGYNPHSASWHPLGSSSTESLRGVLNAQSAIDEDGSDILTHAEPVTGLAAFSRIYLEITVISGTNTAVSAWLTESDEVGP